MSEMDENAAAGEQADYEEAAEAGAEPDVGLETTDADAAEQYTPAGGTGPTRTAATYSDVNEADAADQERAVEFDEEDYR